MIAFVRGEVTAVGLDQAVIDVGGVGLAVRASPGTLAMLRVGAAATLHTSLVVREDSLTLFGFAAPAAKELFELVQSVSGVGPKIALALLAVLQPAELRAALAGGDAATLMRAPGIGRKSAERLILELQDKVGPLAPSLRGAAAGMGERLVEALAGLGFTARQAEDAVAKVVADSPEVTDVGVLLRLALGTLGAR